MSLKQRPGRNALFIPGPTNVPEVVRQALNIPMEDQRASDYADFVCPLFADLKKVFRTTGGEILVFPGSGTAGWEAALTNTLSPGDKVLASRFGVFSELWVTMCERLGLEVEALDVPWGEGVPVAAYAERLAADKSHSIKAVLVTHNETATGVTSDIAAVRRALDAAGHPALLFVDGVSSIGSLEFRMEDWGVDLAVSGSQKGFMLPTGLAIVGVSEKALEAGKRARLPRSYLDFAPMVKANQTGVFPYTPASSMLRGLRVSVDKLLAEGVDQVVARHYRLGEATRRAVAAWGFTLVARAPQWHSDTVSAIFLPEGHDSAGFIRHAYERFNLSFGAGLARVAGRAFRIGHLGDLNEWMILSALAGAELALRDFGVPVELGSGVAAAQSWLLEKPAALAAAAQ